ncbi:hypothetical protein BV898_18775 [Hypsibius exemplaris]|uniref:DIX domain-containing protein n=1 Tax=Hypsibius exemplaris TaxID=2072580 RepID=A0A9X6NPP4_HYPEX|nr:hypothetical protein BV898_18775 [Hypsibius exemplaris]
MHSAQRGAVQPQLQSARRPQNFTQPAVGQSRETTHHQTAPLRGSSRISAPLSRTVRRRAQGDAAADDASTTVLYRWGHASTEYFMSKLTGRPDLKNFKNTILSAKQRAESGFRFSFKIELKPHEVVFMDVSDDDEILPLYEHRITATIIEK